MARTLHLKQLVVYKAEFHRRILEPFGILEAESQSQEVAMFGGISGDHRRILESFDILEAETANGLLKRGYRVLPMYKDDTGEDESQGQEVTMFGGIAKDHREILESFNILEAETASGLLKRGYQVLPMYKDYTGKAKSQGHEVDMFGGIAGDHRRILESFDILEAKIASGLLKRGYQVISMSKDDSGETSFHGMEVARFVGVAKDHRRIMEPCEM